MGFPPDVIELQLSHQETDDSRGAYNRTDRIPEHRQMIQIWSDLLDQSRLGDVDEEIESVRFEPVFRPISSRKKSSLTQREEEGEPAELS